MPALREESLWISPADYLEGEKLSTVKHEYVEGRVFAMAGASADHDRIARNIYAELRHQLRGKKCEPFGSDMKVKVPPTLPNRALSFYYPDVLVACDPAMEANEYFREYPSVIVEVLSPSNRTTDLREKRAAYSRIPTLENYLLVEQDRMEVIVYTSKTTEWHVERVSQPADVVRLDGIGCEMTLAQIYERVSWHAAAKSES